MVVLRNNATFKSLPACRNRSILNASFACQIQYSQSIDTQTLIPRHNVSSTHDLLLRLFNDEWESYGPGLLRYGCRMNRHCNGLPAFGDKWSNIPALYSGATINEFQVLVLFYNWQLAKARPMYHDKSSTLANSLSVYRNAFIYRHIRWEITEIRQGSEIQAVY
jgi:hypothetical protein